ncbi:23S rRNA (guanosine(2251)-2'-O)-methyltransferase RlmB [Candidatus Xianfuyuplasma coldseepsis]|uniref:23S rRNA (Guanosine(2251)-2'-O)-methyltransferase RlmB n=1 Tax=Candidatus Xianfuyuplasma coldseepsis TaxID=2782163 RepID=A0A7L7KSF7_9MOLU|nr:23S rRNA (guanosine(2251)-2'-O)-methyltransferase RlmB [Xianfuyuplasma coldseepsis]QMS85349.1 23S rRNA (guanosine(2251)-2'-O)-methyltransferase RlmB [Xianfuyuplasma coldseepsis]
MATIITGKNTIMEAIRVGRTVYEIYIQDHTNREILKLARENNIPFTFMNKQTINETLPPNHQGVGAKIEDYTYLTLEEALAKPKNQKVFVMLDGLEDPHNLGAILRSADAFNVDGIIIPKKRSVQLTTAVAKVSTGAIEHVDVISVTNLHQTILTLKENGFWVVGTDMNTNETIHDIQVETDLCIVIGSEGRGMSRLIRDHCDYIVKIPMNGHVNSLNASVSAALVLYEVFRRKGE